MSKETSENIDKDRFKAAVEAISGIIWTNSPDGRMEGEQPDWATLTGQSYDEYQGHGWADAVHPDDAQATIDAWNEAVDERKPFVFEHRVKCANGEWRLFSIRAIPILEEDGKIREWVGVHTDITQERQAVASLEAERQKFKTMANAIPQLAWITDETGSIYWYNQRWYEYTGTSFEDVEGWGWKQVHHPDHIDRVIEHLSGCFERGEDWEDTFPLRGKNGEYRWFLSRAKTIKDEKGRIKGWFGTNTDITERLQKEEKDNFLLKLDDAMRSLSDPVEITQVASTLLGVYMNVDRCAYADIEADEDTMNLLANYLRSSEIKSLVGRLRFSDFGDEVLALMRENKPYVVQDIYTHTPPVKDVSVYENTQIAAVICVPLHKEGKFVAAMAVHTVTPREWTDDEVILLRKVANR
jgi:PAS domain S-box-containing protein